MNRLSMSGALVATTVAAVLAAWPAEAQSPLRLDLNIPELRLVVYEGDAPIRSYPVAVGMPGHDTPTGRFSLSRAEWNPWWRPPQRDWARNEKPTPPGPRNPMGRVKLFFAPLYFIHGTPDGESIGSPASHGCVRMHNKDVIALARLLHERAAPEVSPKEIDRILAHSGRTRAVRFQASVPLTIRYDPVVVRDGQIQVYPDFYGRNAVHTESVYQAMLAAGYDVAGVTAPQVRRLLERARKEKGPWRVSVEEAFGGAVALRTRTASP